VDGIGWDIMPMLRWHQLDNVSFSLLTRKGRQRTMLRSCKLSEGGGQGSGLFKVNEWQL
jgi:hypothetical protein